MATIGQGRLDAATTGFRVIYKEGFEAAKPFHEPFCQVVPSTGAAEDYLIPGGAPTLREWVGERHFKNLKVYEYILKNKKFEATITVPREKVEDDEASGLGFYDGQIRQMGGRTATYPSKLLATLLEDGFTELCYDGSPFFDDEHEIKGGAEQSNLTDAPLSHDAFDDAMAALLSMKDYQGEPIDPISMGGEIYLVVPTALRATGMEILEIDTIGVDGGSKKNKNYKAAKLVVCPYLSSDVKWYLLVGGAYRPFILQNRTQPEMQALTSADSDHVVLNDEYLWGIRWRFNMGYGVYQLAYGSTGDAS